MVLSFVNVIFVRCVAEVGLRGAVGAQGKMKLAGCHAGCVAVRVYMYYHYFCELGFSSC
jgi:hypothetical protein